MFHRYGQGRPGRVTSGDVFLAVSRDDWTRDKLGEVYRKLFEGEGVRKGSSPDHFVYVTPGKARMEISELSTWIGDRFGDPAGTVPAKTPFGYLSSRYDGWVTLFAALVHGGDRSLAADFEESIAGMSWATYGGSSRSQAPAPGAAAAAPASSGKTEEPREVSRFMTPYPVQKAPVYSPSPPSTPAAPKPTFVERFMGVTPTPAKPVEPVPVTVPVVVDVPVAAPSPSVKSRKQGFVERTEAEELEEIREEKIARLRAFGKAPAPVEPDYSTMGVEEQGPSEAFLQGPWKKALEGSGRSGTRRMMRSSQLFNEKEAEAWEKSLKEDVSRTTREAQEELEQEKQERVPSFEAAPSGRIVGR